MASRAVPKIYQVHKYVRVFEQKTPTLRKQMGKKKKTEENKIKGKLAGARTRVLTLKVAPKLFGSAACFVLFLR